MGTQNSTTFRASDKTPEQHYFLTNPHERQSHQDQLKSLRQYQENKCTELLQSSNFPERAYFDSNGFVNTVIDCYNNHHNLILRPDDVWAAIMTQFSFFVNKNAEEFRGKFVDFKGKKELTVSISGTLRSAPYDLFVKLISKEIDRNLVDPEVKKWILPNFSTTTDNDLVTVGVVFMATMKKYFNYGCSLFCGIPNVTLEGTTDDWKNIHGRLEKLKEYKLEKWYNMLEPILQQFVKAKKGKPDLDFWQKICHVEDLGSGTPILSGWITAFCVFDEEGNQGRVWNNGLRIDISKIPTGIIEVDVKVDDGEVHNTLMFAGHMAAEIKSDGCTLQPTLGWAIALKPDEQNRSMIVDKGEF